MPRTKNKKQDLVKEIVITSKTKIKGNPKNLKMIPTGSTLLNLALSDDAFGGFASGKMVNLIGDKGTGKSFLAHSILAEAASKKRFADYELDHDDVESAIEYNIDYLFGKKLKNRLNILQSTTIIDFKVSIWKKIESGIPMIYTLDSFDALTSDEEITRMKEEAKAKDGAKQKGSWKTEKVRGFSEMLRLIIQGIKKTDSLLIIISQVRENLDAMPFTPKYRRTGGKALEHNESYELWLASVKKIKKGKAKHIIGVQCKVNITKNRMTGKSRSVEFPIYYDYGIDDITSCIDYLLGIESAQWWKKRGTNIVADGLDFEGSKKELVAHIEGQGLEKKLKKITGEAWASMEESLKLNRKRKYS